MENSRQTGSHFPPGFRFHPTDQELINHYLKKKVSSSLPPAWAIITEVDLYKFNPWELPEKALFGEKEWFFFSPRDRKYPNGVRPNRSAGSGYWKATGIDKPILASDGIQCIGVKKALIFYQGHPSKGTKTQWVMHEYRLLNSTLPYQTKKLRNSMRLDDWVLCRIKKKGAVETEGIQVPVSLKPSPPAIINSQQVNQQLLGIEQNSVFEWSDTQLFSYLIGSLENGEISVGGESDSCSNTRGSNHGEHFENFEVQLQSPQLDTTAYSSMKKRLSSAMDELMELPARKRFECSNDEQCFWLEDIFALDQGLMEFL